MIFEVECDTTNETNERTYVARRQGNISTDINKILLSLAASKFEVVVFTASPGRYANKLLDILDPGHCLVHHRLDREHCHYHQVNIFIICREEALSTSALNLFFAN